MTIAVVTTTQIAPIQGDVDMPMALATGPATAYPAGRKTMAPIQLYALTRESLSGAIACWSAVSQMTVPNENAKPARTAAAPIAGAGACIASRTHCKAVTMNNAPIE